MRMLSFRMPPRAGAALVLAAVAAGSLVHGQKPATPSSKPLSTGSAVVPGVSPMPAPVPSPVIPGANVLHLTSTIGSFKLLGSDTVPVSGTVDVHFNGTILISELDPKGVVQTTGTVHLEKETADKLRRVYFGNGSMVVRANAMRSLQFFGKNLQGTFTGTGIFRLFGEFDKKLETGFYWYEGDDHHPWGTSGAQVVVPNPSAVLPSGKVNVHPAG